MIFILVGGFNHFTCSIVPNAGHLFHGYEITNQLTTNSLSIMIVVLPILPLVLQ